MEFTHRKNVNWWICTEQKNQPEPQQQQQKITEVSMRMRANDSQLSAMESLNLNMLPLCEHLVDCFKHEKALFIYNKVVLWASQRLLDEEWREHKLSQQVTNSSSNSEMRWNFLNNCKIKCLALKPFLNRKNDFHV